VARRLARYDALALTASLWFLAKFLRYAFPPLFPTFQVSFGASNTVLGTIFTAMMLVYAAMQFPSGVLGDRIGPVRVIAGGGVVAAAGAVLLTLWESFALLVAGMVLVGLGTGAHKTVAVRLMGTVYPGHTGRALGVLDTLGAFGGVAAPAAVVAATGAVGWRAVFVAAAVAGAALVALFVRQVPRHLDAGSETGGEEEPTDDGGGVRAYATAFRDRRLLAFVGVTVLFSFGYNGVVAFLPLYLADAANLPTATASLLYSVLFLLSAVQAVTGDLSDRVGRLPVIVVLLALAAASLAALVALRDAGPWVLGGAVVAFGVGAHGFRPVRAAYLVSVIPDSSTGGVLGVIRTLLMGAGAVAPAVVGAVSDAAGFPPAFGLLAASMAAGAVLAAGLVVIGR
jgi:MFS family permease